MAEWITIESTDLDDYLVAAQTAALRSAALGAGQTDPFSRVMPDVCSRIRAEIRACPANQVSETANSIPPELKSIACALLIEAMQARLPMLKLTEDQKKAADEGRKYLARIAKCEIPVEQPDDPLDPDSMQRPGGVELLSSSTRLATRAKLAGL